MSDRDKTAYLIELLRWHHKTRYQGEWATFIELRGSTGYLNPQSIDFFAIHTWPSKSFHSISYEVKVSRGDFRKEIKCPRKRQFAESVSHESYFVTPPSLVRVDEVPEGWGLMEAVTTKNKLRVIKPATRRYRVDWPVSFTVSIASRVADPAPTQQPLFVLEA